ncbi:hypothetical protein [Streptomyces sp. ITFR-6]|uniref:hypothetical protein n=1 Tax=Streptomyces sp. ITFR-6 TaxID=3075197 RepID=UPI002888FA31|nr:hypothetical protein [Streptomyces sp. ITFR-6]WNI34462.1 hypothetical protein RLT59_38255 [Streptomyces sp. ITFR-6]
MTSMDQGVAAVIAAGVAGVVGVTGSLIGMRMGRRQVSDEAQVEHEQWLRGQRQATYVAVLDAWDTVVKHLRRMIEEEAENQVLGARYEAEHDGMQDVWGQLGEQVRAEVDDLSVDAFTVLERVQILGPESVDKAAINLEDALHSMCGAIRARTGLSEWPDYAGFAESVRGATNARREFMNAARSVLRAAPHPGKR